jgi:hypothetical protein
MPADHFKKERIEKVIISRCVKPLHNPPFPDLWLKELSDHNYLEDK